MPRLADTSWCLFAASAVGDRLAAVAREAACVRRGEDAECVHRMRVASRRLNTALGLFAPCFGSKRLKAWNKGIRRLRKALGAARDTDVQIEFVTGFLLGLDDEAARAGVERLLLRRRQARAALQDDVREAIARVQASGVLRDIRTQLKSLGVRAGRGRADPRAVRVYQRAAAAMSARRRELKAFEPFVRKPECVAEHHRMRIAAKHLRYTMEIFRDLYPDRLKAPVQAAREAQARLGELHDLDVWIAWLPRFLAKERDRTSEYFGDDRPFKPLEKGILAMEKHCRDTRAARYAEFVEFWGGLGPAGIWDRFAEALRYRPEPPAVIAEEAEEIASSAPAAEPVEAAPPEEPTA